MKKAHYNALERVFAAEIEGRLPFQSKAKVYKELEIQQLAQPMTSNFSVGGLGMMKVHGWQLTHLGRLFYCVECSPEPQEVKP